MKSRVIISAAVFLLSPFTTNGVMAQAGLQDSGPPEWYVNPPEYKDIEVVVSSSETFPMALVNSLALIYVPQPSEFESIMSKESLGPISISSLHKEFIEEVNGDKIQRKSFAIKITLAKEDSTNIELKFFEEESTEDTEGYLSITYEGLKFSDFIGELTGLGVRITHESTLTKSFVKLEVPVELFLSEEEILYRRFMESRS